MRFFSCFIIFFVIRSTLISQNLILNPSFEELSIDAPTHWRVIAFTPDFYIEGEEKNNFHDSEVPFKFGKCFLGLMSDINWSEILQGELKEPLVANQVYQVKIQACKHMFCPSGFFNLEVAFSDGLLKPTGTQKVKHKLPFVNLYCENMDTVKKRDVWTEFTGYYTAKGGEKYVSIGKFSVYHKDDNSIVQTDYDGVVYEDMITRGCTYIYYDSIFVEEYKVPYAKPIVLENIFFDTNKSVLLPQSFPSLNRLYSVLTKLPTTKIKISGHTDNVGNSDQNIKLSLDRANAVRDYLIKKGINKSRLKTEGLGDKKPVGDNKTIEGRDKNRRVEFEYFK